MPSRSLMVFLLSLRMQTLYSILIRKRDAPAKQHAACAASNHMIISMTRMESDYILVMLA